MYIYRPVYGPHDTLDRGGGPCRRARLPAYLHARYKPAPLYRKAIESGFIFLLSTYTSAPRSVIICRAFRRGAARGFALSTCRCWNTRVRRSRLSRGDSGIYAGTEDRVHRRPESASISLFLSFERDAASCYIQGVTDGQRYFVDRSFRTRCVLCQIYSFCEFHGKYPLKTPRKYTC